MKKDREIRKGRGGVLRALKIDHMERDKAPLGEEGCAKGTTDGP